MHARVCRSSTFCVTSRKSRDCCASFTTDCARHSAARRECVAVAPDTIPKPIMDRRANASGVANCRRIEVSPVTFLPAKRRDAALGGNTGAGNNKNAPETDIAQRFLIPTNRATLVLFFQPRLQRLEIFGHRARGNIFAGRFLQDFAPIFRRAFL